MKIAIILSVLLAAATSVWTWMPRKTTSNAQVETTVERLTADGAEIAPERVAFLSVSSPESDGTVKNFEVKKEGNAWVIPSQYNYPADGGTRVGATSGGFLNVHPGAKITEDTKKHAELGVLDPLAASSEKEGRGKRVTLKDAGGAVLVDLIIGKRAELADVYYVRDARQNVVYTAKVDPDIRTSFKDWVETDLLKINSADIRTVAIKDYSVDAGKGAVNMRAETDFTKPKDKTEWSSQKTPEGKIVNQETVGKIVSELTSLRLVGIRPFSNAWLQSRGFYVANGNPPTLYGKEGVVEVTTKDGVRYKLFFGSGALGDDQDKSAESKTEPAANAQNRYMAVLTEYDAAADEDKPVETPESKDKPATPQSPAKVPAGRTKAEKAQRRFIKFFYVVSDESFKKMRPSLEEIFKDKPKEEKKDEKKDGIAPKPGEAPKPPQPQPPPPASPTEAPKPPDAPKPSEPAKPAKTPEPAKPK